MAKEPKKPVDISSDTLKNQELFNELLKSAEKSTKGLTSAQYKYLQNTRESLEIQKAISRDKKQFGVYLKKVKELEKDIVSLEEQKALASKKNKIAIQGEIDKLNEQKKLYVDNLKKVRGFRTTIAGIGSDIDKVNKGFKTVKNNLTGLYNFFDVGGMFKMLKAIKTTNAEMGIIGTRSLALSKNIRMASIDAAKFGVGLEDIAKIQGSYSDELGTTDFLSQNTLSNFAALGKVTGMGAEAVGKMAAEMKLVGMSSEKTAKFIDQSFTDVSAMGLNATKVIKNFSQNLKLLNKYNFKGGVKSLMRMAESATKMGVSMQLAAPMAEKLFDIEGAVEMSAQLQVMGGEWAKLGDPFKLMYMARNDMEGLTNSIINATKGAAQFNAKTGEFDIAALEMQRLRKVAEATGLNFEELAQSAKNVAKFAAIKKQISYNFDKQTQDFIENTAILDEKGRAKIRVGMDEKYVNMLTEQDKLKLKDMASQKKMLKDRAKDTQTFDEKLKDLITMLKTMALPIIETINNILAPKLDSLMKKFSDPKFIGKVEEFATQLKEKLPKFVDSVVEFGKTILGVVKTVGKFILEYPKLSAGIALAIGGLKWWYYGVQLGGGFMSVARNAMGSMGGMGGGKSQVTGGKKGKSKIKGTGGKAGKMGKMGKMGRFSAGGAAGGLLMGGLNSIDAFSEGKTGEGIGNIAGGVLGGILGTALDPFLGPFGTILGAQLGAAAGGALGGIFDTVNDGVIFNPKDKFMKMNDGAMIAGTNINGNKQLAQALSSMAPTFSNKNSLMNSSRNAGVNANIPGKMNHSFDDLKINGTIRLETDKGVGKELSDDLLKDPSFIRSITRMVHTETNKNLNGRTVGN